MQGLYCIHVCVLRSGGFSHIDFRDQDVCDAAEDCHKVKNVPGVLQVVLGWAGKQTTRNNNETKNVFQVKEYKQLG